MKGFFEDHQVKRYSFNDKIKWVFEHLITCLHPYQEKQSCYIGTRRIQVIRCFLISQDQLSIANTIEIPTEWSIQLEVTIEKIILSGITPEFNYSFPPDMIMEIYNRTKKLK